MKRETFLWLFIERREHATHRSWRESIDFTGKISHWHCACILKSNHIFIFKIISGCFKHRTLEFGFFFSGEFLKFVRDKIIHLNTFLHLNRLILSFAVISSSILLDHCRKPFASNRKQNNQLRHRDKLQAPTTSCTAWWSAWECKKWTLVGTEALFAPNGRDSTFLELDLISWPLSTFLRC